MRAATRDPCLQSTIDLSELELPKLPWTSLLLVATGTFLAVTIATRAFGFASTGSSEPPTQPAPATATVPEADQVTVEAIEPAEPPEPAVVRVDAPLFDVNRREMVVFALPLDGVLTEEEADEVAHFMRCRRTGRQRHMDPGVLAMLADLAQRYPGHVIEIVSAYRAKPYTTPQNRHRRGRAIDLRIRNVSLRTVRDYLWTTHTEEVGIGYYPHASFIHMDYRPEHNAIAWTQKRRNAPLKYNPWWAIKLRREAAKRHVADATATTPPSDEAVPPAVPTSDAATRLARAPAFDASRRRASAARAATPLGRSSSMPRR